MLRPKTVMPPATVSAAILLRSLVIAILAFLALTFSACSDPPPSVYPTQPVYIEDTTAAPTDLLEIRVAKQDTLSGEFEIDASGTFSFPYVGVVQADGKTPQQIGTEIHDKLADGYLRNPQVVVRIKEHRSKKVSVFGEVRKGSIIQFADGMTIIEAISEAGGFTPRAWENAVKVTRKADGKVAEYTVPVKAIANGQAAQFFMRPGDAVYVPKSPM
jgi:protein involved in polysaccharide export with SLBB domain